MRTIEEYKLTNNTLLRGSSICTLYEVLYEMSSYYENKVREVGNKKDDECWLVYTRSFLLVEHFFPGTEKNTAEAKLEIHRGTQVYRLLDAIKYEMDSHHYMLSVMYNDSDKRQYELWKEFHDLITDIYMNRNSHRKKHILRWHNARIKERN